MSTVRYLPQVMSPIFDTFSEAPYVEYYLQDACGMQLTETRENIICTSIALLDREAVHRRRFPRVFFSAMCMTIMRFQSSPRVISSPQLIAIQKRHARRKRFMIICIKHDESFIRREDALSTSYCRHGLLNIVVGPSYDAIDQWIDRAHKVLAKQKPLITCITRG
jgi:hypothetical protein